MDWVQLHERAWGAENYPGRPSLQQILEAPCVTFWRSLQTTNKNARYTVKLYTRQSEIEHDLLRILMRFHIDAPREKISPIFIQREPYRIRAVRISLEKENTST